MLRQCKANLFQVTSVLKVAVTLINKHSTARLLYFFLSYSGRKKTGEPRDVVSDEDPETAEFRDKTAQR